jgi:flagellar biogenesis protein FliO
LDLRQKPGLSRWSAAFAAGFTRLLVTVRKAARHVKVRRAERLLQVCETLPLGDRRFLLLVQCDRRRYLIGAAAQAVILIDRLDERTDPALEEIPSAERSSWKGLH